MNNIFENAYFGKAYKTRDGRKAIYSYCIKDNPNEHYLIVDKNLSLVGGYNDAGIVKICGYNNPNLDIISEWQEPIDDEKLNKLAYDYCPEERTWETINGYKEREAYRAGYRKAKQE